MELPGEDESVLEFFNDERLAELVKRVFAGNRDIRLALLKISEARELAGIAGAERLPMVGAEGKATFTGGSSMPLERSSSLELMVPSFQIDLFGKLKEMESAAFEEYLGSLESFRAAKIALIAGVAELHFETRLLSEKELLIRNTLKAYRDSFAFVENNIINGRSSLLDLEEARARVELAEVMLLDNQILKTRAENALKLLAGDFGDIEASLPPPKKLKDAEPKDIVREPVSSEALLKRPDILEAEHALRAANHETGAAKAAFFPSIDLTGTVGFMSSGLSALVLGGDDSWNFGPALTLPLFSGGKLKASERLAEIRREKAVVNYEKAVQTAFREVSDILGTMDDLKARLAAREKYLATQRRVLDLAFERYGNGGISYLEVLDAQRNVYAAEEDVLDLRKDYLSAHASLFSALGGGADAPEPVLPDIPLAPKEFGENP
jgi:Cu(I)/Ag(I) efflux system outer membrane protein